MAPPHLHLQLGGHILRGKFAALATNDELEGEVEQEIAELIANGGDAAFGQRLIQLEHLLDQVRPKCFASLCPIPGTPPPQITDHCHGTTKRRIVLHLRFLRNIIPPAFHELLLRDHAFLGGC
jgi:hypothetical protein